MPANAIADPCLAMMPEPFTAQPGEIARLRGRAGAAQGGGDGRPTRHAPSPGMLCGADKVPNDRSANYVAGAVRARLDIDLKCSNRIDSPTFTRRPRGGLITFG